MPDDPKINAANLPAIRDHSRLWRQNRYVYPVVSRRAYGVSIGVNVNPSKACTFNCVYCQVNRRVKGPAEPVDLGVLIRDLNEMLEWAASGDIWSDPHFAEVPSELRRIHDIAFSGDGEPTVHRNFADLVQIAADVRRHHRLDRAWLVVISNASRFHTQSFRRTVPILRANNGIVWAKLDAGSAALFNRINRTTTSFKRILENIEWLTREMAVIIQTCLFRLDGTGPDDTEIELYIARLRRMLDLGGWIAGVQLYSIARSPAESNVAWLPDAELTTIATRIRDALPELNVEVYGGADVPPQESGGTTREQRN
jgi:wyosine [tRNA(Phe)-imidazoG37] synthetase (radical SAM superfamily)